jgi:hypothetical protein
MSSMTVTESMPDNDFINFIKKHLAAGETVQVIATEPFVTPAKAADILGSSRTFVMDRIKDGSLVSNRNGARHRIPLSELDRFRKMQASSIAKDAATEILDDLC